MLADWKGTPERDADAMREQLRTVASTPSPSRPNRSISSSGPRRCSASRCSFATTRTRRRQGRSTESNFTAATDDLRSAANQIGAAMIVGIDRVLASASSREGDAPPYDLMVYNSAVCVDSRRQARRHLRQDAPAPLRRVHTLRPVAPHSRRSTRPSPATRSGARGPAAFELDGVRYAPNICYETVLPHLIRRQVSSLPPLAKRPTCW